MDPPLEPATRERLEAYRQGTRDEVRLRVRDLEVGRAGVLPVEVRHLHPAKPFTSRSGRQGVLRRVTLGDPTGEVDLVLWGDETSQAVDGPFTPGAHLLLRGPTVKAGYQGGLELHLGGCVVEAIEDPPATVLTGILRDMGETRVMGEPPDERFQADAVVETEQGIFQVALWDEAVRSARAVLPGGRVQIEGATPHPSLEGWYMVQDGRVMPA